MYFIMAMFPTKHFADKNVKNIWLSKDLPVFGFDLSSSYTNYRSRIGISFSHY